MKYLPCKNCEGHYVLRQGPIHMFFGCSRYPRCRAQMDFCKYVLSFIKHYGVNLYEKTVICEHCGEHVLLYNYNLTYDIFDDTSIIPPVTFGMVRTIDKYIVSHYGSGKKRKKAGNIINPGCVACGASQELFAIQSDHVEKIRCIANIPYASIPIEYDELYMAYD